MQKEIVVSVNLNKSQEKMIEDIRWRHIDIDEIIMEELRDVMPSIVKSIVKRVYNNGGVK